MNPSHLQLDYRFAKEWNTRVPNPFELQHSDESSLRYSLFCGDIIFTVNNADFSAPWGWVPILDFAVALRDLASELNHNDTAEFDFTESAAKIIFKKHGPLLTISATCTQAVADVTFPHFSAAAQAFAQRVITDLETLYPELRSNDAFLRLSANRKPSHS